MVRATYEVIEGDSMSIKPEMVFARRLAGREESLAGNVNPPGIFPGELGQGIQRAQDRDILERLMLHRIASVRDFSGVIAHRALGGLMILYAGADVVACIHLSVLDAQEV